MECTIAIDQTPHNFAACAPDLPGCIDTGTTWDEATREMRSVIAFHIESLREHDEPVPTPRHSMPSASAATGK